MCLSVRRGVRAEELRGYGTTGSDSAKSGSHSEPDQHAVHTSRLRFRALAFAGVKVAARAREKRRIRRVRRFVTVRGFRVRSRTGRRERERERPGARRSVPEVRFTPWPASEIDPRVKCETVYSVLSRSTPFPDIGADRRFCVEEPRQGCEIERMSKSGSIKDGEKGPYDPVPTAEKPNDEIKLEAKMSLLNGVTVIVGSIIGSGIFVSPTGVLKYTGSVNASLLVWTASGIYSMIGAYCYAELGCMIKKSGADYAYIMETFGPFLAFIRLWVECMIVRPCSQAIVALTFSVYVLKPLFPDCTPPDDSVRMLAVCCICVLAFINCWDVKWATRVQDIFTYAKLLALFIIIFTGAYQLCTGHTQYFTFDNSNTEVTSIALSFYSGLFAYNGWNYLNFIIEELKDPVRNLPKAIGISCTLVTVVYVFTNMAFYTTLSPVEVLGSEAVAVTYANRLFGVMAWTIPVFVALSTFGAVNGILLTSSRLFYAGACEGQMPEILTMIQISRLTPAPAVICMALLSMLYLCSSNIFRLINYVGFATWLSIGVSVLCLPWLRWSQPNLLRPIKVNLIFPVFYILATLFVTIVPMYASPVETGYGCLMILSSIPVYLIFVAWKNKPKFFQKGVGAATQTLQKLMVVVGPQKAK